MSKSQAFAVGAVALLVVSVIVSQTRNPQSPLFHGDQPYPLDTLRTYAGVMVFSSPSPSAEVLRSAAFGETLIVRRLNEGWYVTAEPVAGRRGYVPTASFQPRVQSDPIVLQSADHPSGVVYAIGSAKVRSKPKAGAPIVRVTFPDEEIQYAVVEPGWYQIFTGDSTRTEWIQSSAVRSSDDERRRREADIVAGEWSWHEEYSYAISEGRVKNISSRPLEHVEALVTFETRSGEFITSDDALIEYDPLLPGQTSPWRVTTRWNPAMGRAHVEFKTLRGEALNAYTGR